MEQALVSIIVPVYNVEQYIGDCISSILSQDYLNIEVICVVDGPSDTSDAICDGFAASDTRVRVFRKENGGLSSARNFGLRRAAGKYVAFVDGDDMLRPYAISAMLRNFHSGVGIVAGKLTSDEAAGFAEPEGQARFLAEREALESLLSESGFPTSACGKLFRRDLFENVEFPEGLIYEDFATIYKTVDLSGGVVLIDWPLYYYRINQSSITRKPFNRKRMDYYRVSEEVARYIGGKYPSMLQLVVNRRTRYSISFLKEVYSQKAPIDRDIARELLQYIRKGYPKYLFSGYKNSSKLAGLAFIILGPAITALICGKSGQHEKG